MLRIMVINGPNLNLLGRREPEIYGRASYADLVKLIYKHCEEMQVQCKIMQSNHEGALVDAIQQAADFCDGIVINPAAYTHTSVAILDALKRCSCRRWRCILAMWTAGRIFAKFLIQVCIALKRLRARACKATALPLTRCCSIFGSSAQAYNIVKEEEFVK